MPERMSVTRDNIGSPLISPLAYMISITSPEELLTAARMGSGKDARHSDIKWQACKHIMDRCTDVLAPLRLITWCRDQSRMSQQHRVTRRRAQDLEPPADSEGLLLLSRTGGPVSRVWTGFTRVPGAAPRAMLRYLVGEWDGRKLWTLG